MPAETSHSSFYFYSPNPRKTRLIEAEPSKALSGHAVGEAEESAHLVVSKRTSHAIDSDMPCRKDTYLIPWVQCLPNLFNHRTPLCVLGSAKNMPW